jgi:hypothetical protein
VHSDAGLCHLAHSLHAPDVGTRKVAFIRVQYTIPYGQGQPLRASAAGVSEPLNRSTFPRAPEDVLLPTVETVELEEEQTLEAWADAHPHATVALQMVYDHRTISARYCPSCRELRTLREEIPFFRRYLEQPTWRIWLDVVGLLTAALLLAHWALWGL